jgi:glutathione synthase/RimK-type ligase-like ATP-grasp enzyme
MQQILCSKKSILSGKLLAKTLQEMTEKKFIATIIPEKCNQDNCKIRYGNIQGNFDTKYNSIEFIRLTSNKLHFSNLLNESNLYVPIFSRDISNVTFPACIRETLYGFRGMGIHVAEDQNIFNSIWKNNFYWTPFIKLSFELRVHIIGGRFTKIFKKESFNEIEEKYPIKTSATCHYSIKEIKNYKKLSELENILKSILGEDNFYALDIGWDSNKKEYFILEANSAPGLNPETVKLYAEFLKEVLEL